MKKQKQTQSKSPQTARVRKPQKQRAVPGSWQRKFLDALTFRPVVQYACDRAGIDDSTAYVARHREPEFAAAWDKALDAGIQHAEAECWRRAKDGTLRPVYQQGRRVGSVREFSDQLAMFMLRAHRPDRYGEKITVTVLQREAQRIAEEMGLPDAAELIAVAEQIANAAKSAQDSLGRR